MGRRSQLGQPIGDLVRQHRPVRRPSGANSCPGQTHFAVVVETPLGLLLFQPRGDPGQGAHPLPLLVGHRLGALGRAPIDFVLAHRNTG